MTTAHVQLTDSEKETLSALAESTGKTQEQLLREAIEHFLAQPKQEDRQRLLRQAKGIWKERWDLPELRQWRAELNRFGDGL